MPVPDALAALIRLSNRIGQDPRLVQPGGGNTSVKLGDTLFVKGSGTDLRTIGPDGFARLSLARLAALAEAESMSDTEMMRFMAGCMLAEGPAPSVETPLHSLLPHRVIVHTHDVATMSLTNVPDAAAERLVGELFGGAVVYVPYSRPGFPLARAVGRMVERIPQRAIGLTLAHHGLVVWGDDADDAERRLREVVGKIDEYIGVRRRGRPDYRPELPKGHPELPHCHPERSEGSSPAVPEVRSRSLASLGMTGLAEEDRRRLAEIVLPAVRGALSAVEQSTAVPPSRPTASVILHYDDTPETLAALGTENLSELAARGMATPEHILRAGRLPVVLELDLSAPPDALVERVRARISSARREYEQYHARHAAADQRPLDD